MKGLIKKITHPFLKLGMKMYYSKPRSFVYDSIRIQVHPDVFPPQLTLSTKILLDFIRPLDLQNKTFLELGCGSGILSLFAAKKGASVTASDINETALAFLNTNASKNQLPLQTIYSDLFEKLENQTFDYILINPPYYPKAPKNVKEKAWFCGEGFEYFENLLVQLPNHLTPETHCYIILSEDCNVNHIQSIAAKNHLKMELQLEKKGALECNFIFALAV